jgi:uncharacterized membrane protein
MAELLLEEKERAAKNLTQIIYALYALSFFMGITAIVAIIMNYVKKDDVAGTFLESHFRWQIRTFWFALLWSIIGGFLWFFAIGWVVLSANVIWMVYRIVKGWLYLNDNKAIVS